MKKILSQIVIFLLLVIAPVSFSTEKIPSFDKPATQTYHLQESRKTSTAIVHRTVKTEQSVIDLPSKKSFAAHSSESAFDFSLVVSHGRAPPASHSV